MIQVGLGAREATISTAHLVTKQITLIGSATRLVSNLAGVYELIASGQLEPEIVEVDFLQIPDRLSNFGTAVTGGHRMVAVPP
ncbi:hypothetical protein [Rhodococcus sp. NPDC057529]|uniref:hypothetical protein n=1 Tax=Rhodococcus sp. NPDC057529 TaxID=3346158 RepID=UPI00366B6722